MEAINDAQPAWLTGGWRVLQALANDGGDREAYAQWVPFCIRPCTSATA